MSAKTKPARQLDKINRAERLLATIATLEEQIQNISASGEVAPQGVSEKRCGGGREFVSVHFTIT